MTRIDLENIEQKFESTAQSADWKSLEEKFAKAKRVFIIANGGLYSVANHLGDDANRLLFKAGVIKSIYSPDSVCFLTSVSNDYGFNDAFVKWLQIHQLDETCLVLGLSCSGRSKNVLTALHYAKELKCDTALISGQSANVLPPEILEVCLNTTYFHTTEILCTILFYELIASCGGKCPNISEEVQRKSISSHISRKDE